jgi:predicted MPP superfamily phosphohydrolase
MVIFMSRNPITIKQKKKMHLIIVLIILIGIPLFFLWQNNDIVITNISYKSSKIGKDFEGFKIAQISDLHNKEFGKNQRRLIKNLKSINPDIIVITGDIIDAKRTNIQIAMEFVDEALDIAPMYYVSGNHEVWSGQYEELLDQLEDKGVVLLEDKKVKITKGGEHFNLIGISDPDLSSSYLEFDQSYAVKETLSSLIDDNDKNILNILLSHRPELIDAYANCNVDLAFTGHAHGGQFRIPYIMGLYAPNQGVFPKYTSGAYKKASTTMIVSRGLGNSVFPIRIFNRPEIVVVTMYAK